MIWLKMFVHMHCYWCPFRTWVVVTHTHTQTFFLVLVAQRIIDLLLYSFIPFKTPSVCLLDCVRRCICTYARIFLHFVWNNRKRILGIVCFFLNIFRFLFTLTFVSRRLKFLGWVFLFFARKLKSIQMHKILLTTYDHQR